MPGRREVLREHRTSQAVELTALQRDALQRLAPSVAIAPSIGVEGAYDLTPGSSIGAIRLPDLSLVIEPKLPIERVLFLVSYASGRWWSEQHARLESADDLVDAIIPGFVTQVRAAYRRGVPQGYRVEEDALQTIRGRPRMDLLVQRRYGKVPPIDVDVRRVHRGHPAEPAGPRRHRPLGTPSDSATRRSAGRCGRSTTRSQACRCPPSILGVSRRSATPA